MRLTALVLFAALVMALDCNDPLWSQPGKADDAGPLYRSTFPKPSPKCCLIDRLPGGRKQLEKGQSNAGETASADPVSGMLKLTAPDNFQTDPVIGDKTVSVGLFRTGLSYGPGTVMSARATFRRPEGPLNGPPGLSVSPLEREASTTAPRRRESRPPSRSRKAMLI